MMSQAHRLQRSYAIGYSTCGFAAGREMDVLIERLAGFGYEGVELELDRTRLHPEVHDRAHVRHVAQALRRAGLRAALGTGGRHVLTNIRHHPSAVSPQAEDRARWLDFLERSIELGGELGCLAIMVHSGYSPPGIPSEIAFGWLVEGMGRLARYAERAGQRLAVEWHPEMFLRTADQYRRLASAVGSKALGCTLDVGHAHCTEDEPLEVVIAALADHTLHVQLEDMKDRVHQHLRLGEGQIDFSAVFAAFDRTGFDGIVALEFNAGDLGGSGDELAHESLAWLKRNVPSFGWAASGVS